MKKLSIILGVVGLAMFLSMAVYFAISYIQYADAVSQIGLIGGSDKHISLVIFCEIFLSKVFFVILWLSLALMLTSAILFVCYKQRKKSTK